MLISCRGLLGTAAGGMPMFAEMIIGVDVLQGTGGMPRSVWMMMIPGGGVLQGPGGMPISVWMVTIPGGDVLQGTDGDGSWWDALIGEYQTRKTRHRLVYDLGTPEESFELVDFRELADDEIRQHPDSPIFPPPSAEVRCSSLLLRGCTLPQMPLPLSPVKCMH